MMVQTDNKDIQIIPAPKKEEGRVRKRKMTYPLPEAATLQDDGRYRIDFGKPVKVAGEEVDHVVMRPCLVRDRMAAAEMMEGLEENNKEEGLIYLLMSNLCDLPPDAWDDLPFRTFATLGITYRGIHEGKDHHSLWRTGDTDEGFTIELRYPIEVDGGMVSKLKMEPMTVGLRKKAAKAVGAARQEIKMIALCCGMEEKTIESLNLWDYQRALECLRHFLSQET